MNPKLDIIIPRTTEPMDMCRRTLDMLAKQRAVQRDDVHIQIVQCGWDADGLQELLDELELAADIYRVNDTDMAVGLNWVINHTKADWMQIMMPGDAYSSLYSLFSILDVLPTKKFDMLWMPFTDESSIRDRTRIDVRKEGYDRSEGKLIRVGFIKEYNICFRKGLGPYAFSAFAEVAALMTHYGRSGEVNTQFIPYSSMRRGWLTEPFDEEKDNVFALRREMQVVRETERRNQKNKIAEKVFHAAYYGYMLFNRKIVSDYEAEYLKRFRLFIQNQERLLKALTGSEWEVMADLASQEYDQCTQRRFLLYGCEPKTSRTDVGFWEWWEKTKPEEKKEPEAVQTFTPQKSKRENVERKVAVYCGTSNVYADMIASAKSLLANNRMDCVYFLIEHDTFPEPLPDVIHTINVNDQEWFRKDGANYNNAWTYMCLMRAAFTKLFPNENKVLSMDIDTVVQGDISALWQEDMEHYYLAGVVEPERRKEWADPPYINFGVVMMNLDKLRKDHMDDKIIEALNEEKFNAPEQDAFNQFCANKILELDNKYNATPYHHITGDAAEEIIIHYAGLKTWKHYKPVRKYAEMTWEQVFEMQKESTKGEQEE